MDEIPWTQGKSDESPLYKNRDRHSLKMRVCLRNTDFHRLNISQRWSLPEPLKFTLSGIAKYFGIASDYCWLSQPFYLHVAVSLNLAELGVTGN